MRHRHIAFAAANGNVVGMVGIVILITFVDDRIVHCGLACVSSGRYLYSLAYFGGATAVRQYRAMSDE